MGACFIEPNIDELFVWLPWTRSVSEVIRFAPHFERDFCPRSGIGDVRGRWLVLRENRFDEVPRGAKCHRQMGASAFERSANRNAELFVETAQVVGFIFGGSDRILYLHTR
jgi:hypothetical protein